MKTNPAFSDFLGKVFDEPGQRGVRIGTSERREFPAFVQIEAMAAASGEECRIALIDISERKRAEEALRQERDAAEELRQAKEAAEAMPGQRASSWPT